MTDPGPWHDPYGRPLVPIQSMTLAERIVQLRRAAGRLLADEDGACRWLGAGLLEWLESGRSLDAALDLRPPLGSRHTVSGLARQAMRDRALLRFANQFACDRRALEILRGERPCPPEYRDMYDLAIALGVPTGPHAVSRARRRVIGKRR